MMRDEFTQRVKDQLGKRVGYICSRPECQRPTVGPAKEPDRVVNIGVAAHITAASPGGARYDPSLTSEERSSAENGIWLCQACAKIIDDDDERYPESLLREWKRKVEARASNHVNGTSTFNPSSAGSTQIVVDNSIAAHLRAMTDTLSKRIARELQEQREVFRAGHGREAEDWAKTLRDNPHIWESLSNDLKSQLLLFNASLVMSGSRNVVEARQLIAQAKELTPMCDSVRCEAMAEYLSSGPENAVTILESREDPDSTNLRASLLLELNRADAAFAALKNPIPGQDERAEDSEAERLRVVAFAHLMKRNISGASLHIARAAQLRPNWESIEVASAMINYYCALSPASLPLSLPLIPVPVEPEFIRRDRESQGALRTAEEGFKCLLGNPQLSHEDKRRFESWLLACLICRTDGDEDAARYCSSLLADDPKHHGAIMWATASNLNIDLSRSQQVLDQTVRDNQATLLDAVALLQILECIGPNDKVQDILDTTKHLFEIEGQGSQWVLWQCNAFAVAGEPERAMEIIESPDAPPEVSRARPLALQALARKTGDWSALSSCLEAQFEATGDPVTLFRCCKLHAANGEWDFVSTKAELLVGKVETAEAVRLAAYGLYHESQYQACLDTIDQNASVFPDDRLPSDVRQLRIGCLDALGLFPKAISDAELLAKDAPSKDNLWTLAVLYFKKGDTRSLAVLSRRLAQHAKLDAATALQLCRWVYDEDQRIAQYLWRRAQALGIPDDLVGSAVGLGFQLGLDQELGSLFARMKALAEKGEGGVRAANFDELLSFARQRQDHVHQQWSFYTDSVGPVHFIADQLGVPLADLYHATLCNNEKEPDPYHQFPLFARHGGRSVLEGFPGARPGVRLNADITAILLAYHLRVLERVEKAFGPVRIPRSTIPALQHMKDHLTGQQPRDIEKKIEVMELLESSKLRAIQPCPPTEAEDSRLAEDLGAEWIGLYEEAKRSDGFLVDFLPLRKRDMSGPPSSLPQGAEVRLLNCRRIVDGLRGHGYLNDTEHDAAMIALGSESGQPCTAEIPPKGSVLVFDGNTPEVLADAGVLRTACECYQVLIEKKEEERIRAAIRNHEQSSKTAQWVGGLIDQINAGLESGNYVILPLAASADGGLAQLEKNCHDPSALCIWELLGFEADENDVIWSDDRFLNGFLQRNGTAIISMIEVLKALVAVDQVSQDDYYNTLAKLRSANVRFLPVESGELAWHLAQAEVRNGQLVETKGLRVIRRYVASCLRSGDIKAPIRPNPDAGEEGSLQEAPFVTGLDRVNAEAIMSIWAERELANEKRLARSDWIVKSLHLDILSMMRVAGLLPPDHNELFLLGLSVANLFARAIALSLETPSFTSDVRKSYFDWLWNRLVKRRFDVDPHIVKRVADVLKSTLFLSEPVDMESREGQARILLLQGFFNDLPECIKDELCKDSDFLPCVGLKRRPTVEAGPLSFDSDNFFEAAEAAVNGNASEIRTLDGNTAVRFRPKPDRGESTLVVLEEKDGKHKGMLPEDDTLPILVEDLGEREAFLRQNRHWFDCSAVEFEKALAEIMAISSPRLRVEAVKLWQESSVTQYYRRLFAKLRDTRHFTEADTVPSSAIRLIQSCRLPLDYMPDDDFLDVADRAAATLLTEEGLEATLERFTCLPTPLPGTIIRHVQELSEPERRRLLRIGLRTAGSLVQRIHLLRLVITCCPEIRYQRLARRLTKGIIQCVGGAEFAAFRALLTWVHESFGFRTDMRELSPSLRLAMTWYHASRLNGTFLAAGADPAMMKSQFERQTGVSVEAFERDALVWGDAAHPRRLNDVILVLSGVAYALGDDDGHVLGEDLRARLLSLAFPPTTSGPMMSMHLLDDPSRAGNILGSFLGGSLHVQLRPILGEDQARLLAPGILKAFPLSALNQIEANRKDTSAWTMLLASVGTNLPDPDVFDRLRPLLLNMDFVLLSSDNLDAGVLALHLASKLVRHTQDEALRDHVQDQVLKTVALVNWRNQSVGDESDQGSANSWMQTFLIDSLLNISCACPPAEQVAESFAEALHQAIDACSDAQEILGMIAQRLYEELPWSMAKAFVPVIVECRSGR